MKKESNQERLIKIVTKIRKQYQPVDVTSKLQNFMLV